MSPIPSSSVEVAQTEAWMPIHKSALESAAENERGGRAETLQRRGKMLVVAGFIITIVGVVLYCGVNFAGGMDADMSDILFQHAAPFTQGTLGVLGLGTLVWLFGSLTYLRGALDADEELAVKPQPQEERSE